MMATKPGGAEPARLFRNRPLNVSMSDLDRALVRACAKRGRCKGPAEFVRALINQARVAGIPLLEGITMQDLEKEAAAEALAVERALRN